MNHPQFLRPAIAAGLLAIVAVQSVNAADVILTGNVLKVGVNNTGGLIDSGFTVGINYSQTGNSVFPSYDFIKPGTPFEFFSVGVNGSWNDQGYNPGNAFGGTTSNTSAGSVLSAHTTGITALGLDITQDLSFTQNGGTIDFTVTFANNNTFALNNVVYARGLDPDQDVFAGGGYPTTNAIPNGNLVTGSAPITDWTIGIFTDSMYAHTPSVQAGWDTNPYNLLTPRNDGYGDYTINMAWNLGDIAAGASKTVTFQYRIAETKGEVVDPDGPSVPDSGSTVALLGLAMLSMVGFNLRRKQA